MTFVSEAAYENEVGDAYDLKTPVRPVSGTRSVRKSDMLHNDHCPDDIEIDAQTFEVEVDGEHVTCDPADDVPLAQRYLL